MKRIGNLFERIVTFGNLMRATEKAASGKKDQPRVAHFLFHQEKECLRLQDELLHGVWQPSEFRMFEIREPKPRRISAADFRDRVVHHAICNILEPVFDKRLIFDSWACRKGKGMHGAVQRAQGFCRRYPYFLKCDIRRYFDSVDHHVLKTLLRRSLKDERLLCVLDRIIDHPLPGVQPGKGLPIGNLTSQHFANLYLGALDQELKSKQGLKAYVRYMDDMLVFTENKRELHRALSLIKCFSGDCLDLSLKPEATLIAPVSEGVPFLGFRIFPAMIRLNTQSKRRFFRRLVSNERAYLAGKMGLDDMTASARSVFAHISHANTLRLRQSTLPLLSVG